MSIGVDRYILHIEANAFGSGNEAQVHFDVDPANALTDAERVAAMIACMSGVGEVALNTTITGVTKTAAGASGGIPVPFPVAAYAAWKAANAHLVTMAGYGVTYGAGALASQGSSATVSIYTFLPGRRGTGRHYRPWVSAAALDGLGELDAAYVTGIDQAEACCFLGTAGGPWVAPAGKKCELVVWSTLNVGFAAGLVYKTSQMISNLHSRRQ